MSKAEAARLARLEKARAAKTALEEKLKAVEEKIKKCEQEADAEARKREKQKRTATLIASGLILQSMFTKQEAKNREAFFGTLQKNADAIREADFALVLEHFKGLHARLLEKEAGQKN